MYTWPYVHINIHAIIVSHFKSSLHVAKHHHTVYTDGKHNPKQKKKKKKKIRKKHTQILFFFFLILEVKGIKIFYTNCNTIYGHLPMALWPFCAHQSLSSTSSVTLKIVFQMEL